MADKVKAVTKAMADTTTAADTPNDSKLHKDEETGEMISKTELKRRQKVRAAAAKKAEKKSAAPPEQKKADDALGDLDANQVCDERSVHQASEANLQQYYEMRSRQVQKWLADGKFNPYPHKFDTNFDPSSFHEKYNHLKRGETLQGKVEYRLGGRIMTQRAAGNKLRFYDVQCQGVMIQVMAQLNYATDQESFLEVHDRFQRARVSKITRGFLANRDTGRYHWCGGVSRQNKFVRLQLRDTSPDRCRSQDARGR
jgi:lysyl-tRNA synthetase, class II